MYGKYKYNYKFKIIEFDDEYSMESTFRVARGGGCGPPLPPLPPPFARSSRLAVSIRGGGGGPPPSSSRPPPPLPKAPCELSSCDCCFCVYCSMLGNFYCRVWHAVCRPDAGYNINVSLPSCSSAFQLLVPSFRPPCSQVIFMQRSAGDGIPALVLRN